MLRFNPTRSVLRLPYCLISIHLMLRFNMIIFSSFFDYIWISIHLMLRFNALAINALGAELLNFNTSYVAVQLLGGLNNVFSCFISIHLMLRFNKLGIIITVLIYLYFNTSYVAVQPFVVIHFTFFIISKKHWSYNIFHYFFQW